jgi:hypothetical protein
MTPHDTLIFLLWIGVAVFFAMFLAARGDR